MTTTAKVLIVTGLGAAAFVLLKGAQKAKAWAGQITVQLIDFFQPSIKDNVFTLPVKLRINNPSPLFAPIQSASLKMFYLKNGMYVPFGQAPPTQGFNINPNESTDVTLFPQINLSAFNPFSGSNTLNNLLSVLSNQNPLLDVKLELTVTITGIPITQDIFKQVYLKQLFKNVA